MAKLPWMQFYPADYMTDTRPLSPAARGIWMDLICLLWRTEPAGTLAHSPNGWARLLGVEVDEFESALDELEEFNICDISDDDNGGVRVSSRRMVREQRDRELNALYQRKHRDKEKVRKVSGDSKRKSQNQSHKSESESETELDRKTEKNKIPPIGEPAKVVKLKKLKVSLPDDFALSDEMKAYAESKGMADPSGEFEHFTAHHKKNDSRFVDWAAAWQTWVLNSAKFGRKETHGKAQLPYGGFATKNYREGVF